MATLTLTNKDVATLTMNLKHGKEPSLADIQNLTFNDVIFDDGTKVKDATFAQLSDVIWTYSNKHNATLTAQTKH